MTTLRRLVTRMMLYLLIALGAYAALACSIQRSMLFPRPPVPPGSPLEGRSDVRGAWIGAEGERSEVWLLPPLRSAGPAPYLLYTHGNGELIDDWVDAFEVPRAWGVGVLLVEYPGYGRSAGKPSEASIRQTMLAAYDFLVRQPDVDPRRIIAYGRSLGGGASCTLLRERPVAALILESKFTSIRPLARRFGLVGPLLLDPFDSLKAVEAYAGPTLVLHGEQDAVIPVSHARELAGRARAAELHLLECGHNDCPRAWTLVRAFLAKASLLPEAQDAGSADSR